jgi:acyl carrier protein
MYAHTQLHPVTPDLYPAVYELLHSPAVAPYWRYRGDLFSPEDTARILTAGVAHSRVVMNAEGRVIALLEVLSLSERDGTAELSVAVASDGQGLGTWLESAEVFVREVFDLLPLRKLYVAVTGRGHLDPRSLESLFGFVAEGTLQSYLWEEGDFRHLHYLSIDRAAALRASHARSMERVAARSGERRSATGERTALLIAEVWGDLASPTTSLAELDLDSLMCFELIEALEADRGTPLADDVVLQFQTIGELLDFAGQP